MHPGLASIHAIILRTSTAHAGMVIAPSFTDTYGRISLAVYGRLSTSLTPFSLIEAQLSRIDNDFAVVQYISLIDTFTEARALPNGAKALFHIRSILEYCLPNSAPSKEAWEVTTSLLSCFSSFIDWKVVPFLIALFFFEQEGLSKEELLYSKISDDSKKKATQALFNEKTEWQKTIIPNDLYEATLELIGINLSKLAKGGT